MLNVQQLNKITVKPKSQEGYLINFGRRQTHLMIITLFSCVQIIHPNSSFLFFLFHQEVVILPHLCIQMSTLKISRTLELIRTIIFLSNCFFTFPTMSLTSWLQKTSKWHVLTPFICGYVSISKLRTVKNKLKCP